MVLTSNLPEGPKIPLFIRLFKFITQPAEYLNEISQVYGDTFTVMGRNDTPIVYFSKPEALQEIFNANPIQVESGRENSGLEFLLGKNSLLLLEGEQHKRHRQLLTPPFHGERMKAYASDIYSVTQQVTSQWKKGKPFNIRHSMQEISLRVILRVVFGLDEQPHCQQLRQLIASVLELMNSRLVSTALFFSFLQKDLGAWSPWGRILRQIEEIDKLIYALIEERRKSETNREDILSLMMSARYEDNTPMKDEELRDELMTLLIAGHETTASALSWALYWIDFIPSVRAKLLEELNSVNGNLEANTINKLPYLNAVCCETLRIYPIALGSFPRVVKSPMEITGYKLSPGTVLIPSIYLAHHREEVYPDSFTFKPERFLQRQYGQYEFLPFGGGNRRCIGMAFALFEMKLVLATILSQFQVKVVTNKPIQPVRRGLTLAPPGGMRAYATPVK